MKRIVSGILVVALACTLTGCGDGDAAPGSSTNDTTVSEVEAMPLDNPDAVIAEVRAQLSQVNADLNDANSSLSTAQQDEANGEGDIK